MINNRLSTRTILCAGHFLKIIAKKADIITKRNENIHVKSAFLFAFSLLQNSTTIKEFENFLGNIIIMFGESNQTSECLASIKQIKKSVSTRNLDYVEKVLNTDLCSSKIGEDISDMIELMNNSNKTIKESNTSLKKMSPFTWYFEKLLKDNMKSLNQDHKHCKPNIYYNFELVELISEYLYILPMWTGILINKWQNLFAYHDIITRITNNVVENWFGRLKDHILMKKKVMPSELVAALYRRLLAKYIRSYFELDFDEGKVESSFRKSRSMEKR